MNATDTDLGPSWTVCEAHVDPSLRLVRIHDSGNRGNEFDVDVGHAKTSWQTVGRKLLNAANLYRSVIVETLTNVDEDYGFYWGQGSLWA